MSYIFIPARGGSKGIPKKNIKTLDGKPLIAYTLDVAMNSDYERLVVSTDSDEIKEVCEEYLQNNFKDSLVKNRVFFHARPHEISGDTGTIKSAISHYLEENGLSVTEKFVVLQPTSPLRRLADVNKSLSLLNSGYNSVVSVCEPSQHPCEMLKIGAAGNELLLGSLNGKQRQQYNKLYYINGAIYGYQSLSLLNNSESALSEACLLEMPSLNSIDIDTSGDFFMAEAMLKHAKSSAEQSNFMACQGQK